LNLSAEIRKSRRQRRLAGLQDHVPLRPKLSKTQTNRFPQPPLQAVADHAPAERLWHGEADAGPDLTLNRITNSRKVRAGHPNAFVVNLPKIGAPQEPGLLGEGERSLRACSRITWRIELLFRN